MNSRISGRLALLNADFSLIGGSPFDHFYCPILFRDEDVLLCQAHIENRAFSEASSEWTVQRKDVDNFFGAHFEAEFTRLEERDSLGKRDVLGEGALRRKLRPKILADNRPVDYFVPKAEVPDRFTALYSSDPLLPRVTGLKLDPAQMENLREAKWEIEVEIDVRVHALVSLIKAAHLAKFHILGYRYALSAAGRLVGHDLLGSFFLANQRKSRTEVADSAVDHFNWAKGMVRPVAMHSGLAGTVDDHRFFICWGSSGKPWATVTFIKAGGRLHAVLLPSSDSIESMVTFLGFLENDNEELAMSRCRFIGQDQETPWRIGEETFRMKWPKSDEIRLR